MEVNPGADHVAGLMKSYAACVFEPTDIVNLRFIQHTTDHVPNFFSTGADLPKTAGKCQNFNGRGYSIYAGVNPRKRKGGTKAQDVALARCLFAEWDGVSIEEARRRWEGVGLPEPTLLLFSGAGPHAYWRFLEALTDLEAWTGLQKRLLAAIGSDNIHDLPRVMRLPGFINQKPDRGQFVELLDFDPTRRYPLDLLAEKLPPLDGGADFGDDDELPDTENWDHEEAGKSTGLKPGQDFDRRGEVREVLRRNDWLFVRKESDGVERWRRPGKSCGISASVKDRWLYCFTTSTKLPVRKALSPFAVLTYLEHDGDFSAAAKVLASKGFGEQKKDKSSKTGIEKSNGKPGENHDPLSTPIIVNLANVVPEPVRWLWPGRIALGKLTILYGEPGLGKSFNTLDIASRVTTGAPWPDDPQGFNQAGSVVLLSAEDDLADTIRPRLDNAGADVAHVVALQGIEFKIDDEAPAKRRCFNLEHDLPALEKAITTLPDTRLVVIDPISSYLGGTDSHKNAEIRGLLAPLAELAARHRVAVLAVTHLNKNAGSKAMHRVTGSLAFIAAARAGWLVAPDKNDARRRLFLPVKNNLAPDMGGLAFSIIEGAVAWERGPISLSADDALDADQRKDGKTQRDDAADWLRELLADGPLHQKDVADAAKANGVSAATLRRAKVKAGVISQKHGNGRDAYWEWRLPDQRCAEDVEDAHSGGLSTFDIFEQSEHLPECREDDVGEV